MLLRHEFGERGFGLVVVKLRWLPNRYMPLGADGWRHDLGPIGIGPEQIEHVHYGAEAEELEHLRRLSRLVELNVVRRAVAGISDGRGNAWDWLNHRFGRNRRSNERKR